jgi:hypothetical protein
MYCTTSLVITYYLFVWLMFINMYMLKITDSIISYIYIYFFLREGHFVVKDILYLWAFCGRTFCRGGRFV